MNQKHKNIAKPMVNQSKESTGNYKHDWRYSWWFAIFASVISLGVIMIALKLMLEVFR